MNYYLKKMFNTCISISIIFFLRYPPNNNVCSRYADEMLNHRMSHALCSNKIYSYIDRIEDSTDKRRYNNMFFQR